MPRLVAVLSASVLAAALAGPAGAQSVIDDSAAALDAGTVAAVVALATRGLADPEAAELRNLHASLARNGMGYCGEVSVAAADGGRSFTVFHAIVGGEGSVLRLSDYPLEATNTYNEAVTQLLRNFGCLP